MHLTVMQSEQHGSTKCMGGVGGGMNERTHEAPVLEEKVEWVNFVGHHHLMQCS